MTTLNIGGVPEHFNLPWHLCMEEGLFTDAGIDVQWNDFPGGTGAMTRELRHGGLDLAVVLTEGMITDISLGNKSKIISFYTDTPLIWGVHTTAYSRFEVVKDIDPPIFAISRWGSGSHLMAYLFAKNQGWDPKKDISFKIVGNLAGARDSLAEKSSNLFLWEKFTTKPFVDSDELKRLTNQPTPWPCFVIAGREAALNDKAEEIKTTIDIVQQRALQLAGQNNAGSLISERYGLQLKDVQEWLAITSWANNKKVDPDQIQSIAETLQELGIIKSEVNAADFIESL